MFPELLLRNFNEVTVLWVCSKSWGILTIVLEAKFLHSNPVWGTCQFGGLVRLALGRVKGPCARTLSGTKKNTPGSTIYLGILRNHWPSARCGLFTCFVLFVHVVVWYILGP